MPNIKISELIEQLSLSNNDVFPFVDVSDLAQSGDGSTRKVTLQGLTNYLSGVLAVALDDLTDATITSVEDGQVLTYNSVSGQWENKDGGGEPDPTDITYTYDGSDRVATQTITNALGTILTTYTYKTDGSNRVDSYTINKYGDVTIHTPTYTPTDSNKITQIVIT